MMSSPSHLHQPLGLSQYQNMMNESPVKPASYYFHSDNSQSNEHGSIQHDLNFQDENFKSGHMNLDPEISQQFLYSDDNQNQIQNLSQDSSSNFIVPVSNNDSTNSHLLQYPPRFEQQNNNGNNGNGNNNTLQPPASTNQQGPLMHSFQHNPNSSIQSNLYPPMEFISNSHSNNSLNQISESTSTNTINSYDSVPLLTSSLISSSVSDNSIASPISFQHNSAVTPRRPNRRPSFSVTPLPSIYQTPAQLSASGSANNLSHNNPSFTGGSITSPIALKTGVTPTTATRRPRHRRTRSRLSLDANGAASIVTINPSTSSNSIKSPANFALQHQSGSQSAGGNNSGTNPFYTPPAFLSPHQGSPATTPLATPSIEKKRSQSNFESISPSMLMNSGLIPQPDASTNEKDQHNHIKGEDEDDDTVFMAAADLTMKLASKLANQSSESQKFLVDPLNTDINQFNLNQVPKIPYVQNDSSSSNHGHGHGHNFLSNLGSSFDQKPNISRSQSSINLASIASSSSSNLEKPHTTTNPNDPYQVKHYDILQPRKKIQKSNSTTNVNDSLNGKKPKKVHACPLCAAVFQRPEHVKRHMRSHSSEKPYECDEPGCGKRFNRGDNLKAHLRKIHQRPI